ncbi:MAG: hypothetical protein J1E36_08330 [Eubacterium sp.]|nr:hypothetical protein [Eubacterium sp.]
MRKITSSGNTHGLLVKYAIKIVLSTLLSILLLSVICSFIVLKLDIDMSVLQYLGTGICIICGFLISFISTSGFKNNFLVLSMMSILPLLVYTVVNFCVNKPSAVFIIVKLVGVILSALVVSLMRSSKKSR